MKISSSTGTVLLALIAMATSSATAETRMQVAAASTPIYAQASAGAQQVGSASSGEILFVSRTEGDWAAISPPDRLDLWLNKDFIEGNRVVARSIQVRSGPGIEYEIVGTLERGAAVMPRGEEGDWCKIAPPSSTTLWVKKGDLSEVRTHTTPIQEVAPVPEPPKPAPAPAPAAAPAPQPAPPAIEPLPPPEVKPSPAASVPEPQPPPVAEPPPPAPAPKVAPSTPKAPSAKPVAEPKPAPAASVPSTPARPVPPRTVAPAAPALKPATALPAPAPRPSSTNAIAPAKRPAAKPSVSTSIPTTPSAVISQKSRNVEVKVNQAYVDDLDLLDQPNQGKAVQVEGELRNAPFMAASPSRYRLQTQDENGILEMICHIHGDSEALRPYVGRTVSIRGREYWVENSDMPVVVVGQIVPLAPADEDEPVLF